jgi:hypothetical protein
LIPPIYYLVNGRVIFNDLLARYESFTTGSPIEFCLHDAAYSRLNWTQEPAESFDELMLRHAQYLRNQYERVVLLWSGGTDSHTIYNIFVGNNIHIDEIVIFHNDQYEPWNSTEYIRWMQANHPDPTTKITARARFDPEAKQRIVTNEDWLFQNQALVAKFAMGTSDTVMWDYCAEQNAGHTWCLISGFEQPRVYAKAGRYYANQIGSVFKSVMGFDNMECFYTEPLLAVKQAHMIKRILELSTVEYNDALRYMSPHGYTAWSRMIGRHPEAIPGMSWRHKRLERAFDFEPVAPDLIDLELTRAYDIGLADLVTADSAVARTFERGIRNLLSERDFCQHLINTGSQPNTNVLGRSAGADIYSKSYCLSK